jgi:membrane protein required for colicin V production
MTFLDYFVLIVVVASTALAATRGILRGIISLLTTVAGLIAATFLYEYVGILFRGFVETERAANLLGFIIVFLMCMIAGSLLSRRLRGALKRARLDWVDHALGATFGFLRGWLFCSVVYMALTAFPVRIEAVRQATFAPFLLEGTHVISYITSSEFRGQFLAGYEAVKELWRKNIK